MTNGFISRKVKGNKTLGEKLEDVRKKANLSLDEVSKKINVQKKYLEYLEKGDYKNLPSNVYVVGYLKSYARLLELDESKVISVYKKEIGLEEKANHPNQDKKDFFHSFPIVITPRMVKIAVVSLIILSIVLYLWYQVSGLSRPPELKVFDPDQDRTVQEDLIIVLGQVDLDSTLSINDQPIHVDSSGNFKENVSLQKGLNVLRIEASNRFDKKSVIERKIMYEPPSDLASKEGESTKENSVKDQKSNEGVNLEIWIKDKATWIQVEADDKVVYAGTMLPDSKQEFKAKDKISLSSGKANTTYVKFNGKDLGALGSTGEVIREMIFTKDLVLEN